MKKYIVFKKIGKFSADEDRQFDNLSDAKMYKTLCETSEENKSIKYFVCEVLE